MPAASEVAKAKPPCCSGPIRRAPKTAFAKRATKAILTGSLYPEENKKPDDDADAGEPRQSQRIIEQGLRGHLRGVCREGSSLEKEIEDRLSQDDQPDHGRERNKKYQAQGERKGFLQIPQSFLAACSDMTGRTAVATAMAKIPMGNSSSRSA